MNAWYGGYSVANAGNGQAMINGDTYIVQKEDTMNKIAKKRGMTLNQLLSLNPQIKNPNFIVTGQKLSLK